MKRRRKAAGEFKALLPRCTRCGRTCARCGEEHWIVLFRGRTMGDEFQRVCCFCVIELNRSGVEGRLIGDTRLSLCPVRLSMN